METIVFYNFILLSSTAFVWLSEKCKYRFDRWLLLSIAFLLIFLPSALRYDIGTDYLNYLRIFESHEELENYKLKEPLFYFVNWFFRNIEAHFQWVFATFAFVFTFVAFKAYPRHLAWLLHLVFFAMLWFPSFNGTRQAIASSWCLLALFSFFDKRYMTFILLTVIGAMFHQSALFILIAGLAALLPLTARFKSHLAPIVFIGFVVFTYISMSVVLAYMEQILNLIGMTKYAAYFSSDKHFAVRDYGSGLGILAKLLFALYIVFNARAFLKINKNYWLLIILTFAYAVGLVLAKNIIIFGRMADTFVIAPIVGAFLLIQLPRNKLINTFVLGAFLAFLILSYVKTSMGIPTIYGDPKLNPYQTIFSQFNGIY